MLTFLLPRSIFRAPTVSTSSIFGTAEYSSCRRKFARTRAISSPASKGFVR